MTLLVISPDYASHLLPLATLASAWREAGDRVVVATGEATASIVASFGYERAPLQLGKGSNPGVIRAEEQPPGEDDALRGFFAATREGMVPTLEFQARARLSDLMWQPVVKGRDVLRIVEEVAPDQVIVDHLAFSARVALRAGGVPYGDVVLGHPSALPIGDEVYGYPPAWPAAFDPAAEDLDRLRAVCERVSERFTSEWNDALLALAPGATPSASGFAERGDVLLYNYPEELADARRRDGAVWLGSAVREEPLDPAVEEWLAHDEPFVYVSFGSFLSVRSDVLARVVRALAERGLRAAVAIGSARREELGPLPAGWLVREFLPQVRLLDRAAAAVTHGGNNSVTEALTAGVPLLVLPYSTDQFAGAAAIESAGFGLALDPNAASVAELGSAIDRVLSSREGRLADLSAKLRQTPGRDRARSALTRSSIATGSPDASR